MQQRTLANQHKETVCNINYEFNCGTMNANDTHTTQHTQ